MGERTAPPLLLAATMDVLRPHAPFAAMREEDLAFLAGHLRLRYFAGGTTLLSPEQGVVGDLYIVQRGLVRSEDARGTALHSDALTLTPGESFPVGALIGQRAPTLTYTAVGDTFCYLLDAARFQALLDRSREFRDFCTRRLAHLLAQSHAQLAQDTAGRAAGELGLAAPLAATVRREPVTLPESARIREMLALMKERRIGSVVLTDDEGRPSGIFTQTDVLDRVALAPQVNLDRPARDVMTPHPFSLPASSSAGEAAQLMARHGFRHLLVTEGGRLAGVVSERDLFAAQRRSIQGLSKEIRSAMSPEGLAVAAREVRSMAHSLLGQGLGAEALTQLVTTLNDAIAERAVALAAVRHDLEGVRWCWIGLGSEGRREQTLATDQDNAIIFVPAEGSHPEPARSRLLPFAADVNAILDAAGFPLCKGDIMARNPRWCLSLEEWCERFDDWMRNAQPEALLNAAIFFDFRALAGHPQLADRLRDFLLGHVAKRPSFLRQMAANALASRPPLGVLGDIVVDDGALDLKLHGSRPFVDAARILALGHGVAETSTAGRILQAAPSARLGHDEAGSAVDAFHFIQMLRLRNQDFVERGGGERPNLVDPGRLHALDVRILKEALRQARKLQNRIALDYRL